MQVLLPSISCICDNAREEMEAVAQGYKEIYTIVNKEYFKRHIFRGENRFVRLKVASIPGYTPPPEEVIPPEALEQKIAFLPAGKIPNEIWQQVIAFFKKVMEVKKSEVEAMIHVLYNAERGYHIGVPPQTVSKASASYDWSYIPAGTSVIVDVHSHNTMGAFFSGTDERDDQNAIGFSGVVGKLKDKEPEVKLRFNYYKQKYEIKLSDIFHMPTEPVIEVPDEWLANVNTPTYQHNNVYQGGRGKRWDHLSQYQFKPQNTHTPSGERTGPGMRALPGPGVSSMDDIYGDGALGFLSGVQGQLPLDPQFQKGNAVHKSVSTGQTKGHFENQSGDNEVEELEMGPGGRFPSEAVGGIDEDEYSLLAIQYGGEVANAFSLLNDCMPHLDDKPELINEAVSDLFGMMREEDQYDLFKELYRSLPMNLQHRIAENGI